MCIRDSSPHRGHNHLGRNLIKKQRYDRPPEDAEGNTVLTHILYQVFILRRVTMRTGFYIFLCMLSFLFLNGCKAKGEATLIDNNGRFYYGIVSFNPQYQTGTITFPETPYGSLTGPFTVLLTDDNPIIKLDNLPMKRFNGKAHLGNQGNRYLECDITVEFKTKGMGDMKMVGCGTCYDKTTQEYDILLQ